MHHKVETWKKYLKELGFRALKLIFLLRFYPLGEWGVTEKAFEAFGVQGKGFSPHKEQ